jgi:hypothetical protein
MNTPDRNIPVAVPKTPDNQPVKVKVPETPRKVKLSVQVPDVNLPELLSGFDDSIPRNVSKKLRFE